MESSTTKYTVYIHHPQAEKVEATTTSDEAIAINKARLYLAEIKLYKFNSNVTVEATTTTTKEVWSSTEK